MSDRDAYEASNDADVDPGEPIEALAGLARSPEAGFMGGLRRAIHRRVLVSQAAEMSWNGVLVVLFEYLDALFEIFKPADSNRR